MIQHATKLCRFADVLGGHYTCEWPERCELWADPRVRALTSVHGFFATISASAVDWFAIVNNKEVTIKQIWKIWTSDDRIAEAFLPYCFDLQSDRKYFVQCHITRRNFLISYGDRSLAVVSLAMAPFLQTATMLLQPAEDLKVLLLGLL